MTLNVVALLPHILIDYCLLGFLTNTHTHIFLWGKYLNYIFESCLQKSPKRHTFDSIRGMKKKNGVAKWNFFFLLIDARGLLLNIKKFIKSQRPLSKSEKDIMWMVKLAKKTISSRDWHAVLFHIRNRNMNSTGRIGVMLDSSNME